MMKPSSAPLRAGTASARTATGSDGPVLRRTLHSPRQGCTARPSSTARTICGCSKHTAMSLPRSGTGTPSPISDAKAWLAKVSLPSGSITSTGSAEAATVARICVSWCSAISSRTACTCTMMSTSAAPTARASTRSALFHGTAVPRTISLQASKLRRGDSCSGSSATIGLAGLPAQVTLSSCSLRNHIR